MPISFNNVYTFNKYNYQMPNVKDKKNNSGSTCIQKNNKRTDRGIQLFDYLKNNSYIPSVEFYEKYEKKYKGQPLSYTVLSALKNTDCYINQGSKNITFKMPSLDDYIIRIPKSLLKNLSLKKLSGIKPQKDDYPEINLGQAIMENSHHVQICKKQTGRPIAACDWAKVKENPDIITYQKALNFLSDMELLSEFPVNSFKNLIRDLKQIDKHEIDCLNPNNFLIDEKNKKISRVDVTDIPKQTNNPITKESIIFPLINIFVHSYFYDKLDENEQKRLDSSTIKIIEKCNIAVKEENLPSNPDYISDYWKEKIVGYMGEEKLKELQSDIDKTVNRYYKHIYSENF